MDNKEKELYSLIGKRITELRKKAGYKSQESLANELDTSQALYGRYEKGTNMTLKSLHRVLKFHKISFEEFFKEGFENL